MNRSPFVRLVIFLLLAALDVASAAHSHAGTISVTIEEKDLYHYYVTSPSTTPPCTTFTAAGLPAGSSFDTATGLFTWLPDYGTAGSYSPAFSCADDPDNPGTQNLQLSVTAATPRPIFSNSPRVTLVAAKTPPTTAQANDQKSLGVMLGVYGLAVDTVEDLKGAFAAQSVGEILVLPSYMAASLTADTVQQVVAWVKAGGSILLFGKNQVSEALGISFTGSSVTVTRHTDYLNPKLPLHWSAGETVQRFSTSGGDTVLTVDATQRIPIAMGRKNEKGRILYVGTDYFDHHSEYGTKGHTYLLYHVMDHFRLKPKIAAASIDAYFDPGNYDLNVVYVEDLVRLWAERGITTVYAAAWHFWKNEQTGVEWTFGYDHFIDVCHRMGIQVYAWFALPHVSQKFWLTRPECREQTAGTGEKYIFWRLNVNLQNQDCLTSVLQFVDNVIDSYPWDGINLAEIYYDYEQPIEYFTPMNADLRTGYAAVSGFDPLEFFNPASPHYYQTDTTAWNQFLKYRSDLVTGLHKTFMDRIFDNPKTSGMEVILTAVDNLNYTYPDMNFPPGYTGSFDPGVDLQAIIALLGNRDFLLQVEDSWPFWSSNPFRYRDFKTTYLTEFSRFAADESSLMFDVNIVDNAHPHPLGDPAPLYNFPTVKQTGLEFSLLLKNMFADSRRLALFSENTVESVDFPRLKWALGADASITEGPGGSLSFSTKRPLKLEGNPTFYSVSLDGKEWPAWSAADRSVLLPAGSHTLRFDVTGAYKGIRLVGINTLLKDAAAIPGGLTVTYDSPRQKAVVTIEAFDKKESEPFRIMVDGQPYTPVIYPFYGHYRLFLPKGQRTVQIQLVRELAAGNTLLGGAADASIHSPVALTFTNPVDPATVTAGTFTVRDASGTLVPGTVSYDVATMTAAFRPDQTLASGTSYTMAATSGIRDIYGTPLPATALTFTTDSYGDINNTKRVDIAAATKYLRVALGLDPQPNLPPAQIIIAPINRATGKPQPQAGRTRVNVQDAVAALERVAGFW